eukprot:3427175-Prymnesium_polylepis.2
MSDDRDGCWSIESDRRRPLAPQKDTTTLRRRRALTTSRREHMSIGAYEGPYEGVKYLFVRVVEARLACA